jgi:hypothetical protein
MKTLTFFVREITAISPKGVINASDEEVVSSKGERGKWEPILGLQDCGPSQRCDWKLAVPTKKAYTPSCIKHRSMNARLSNLGKYLAMELGEFAISWVEQESQDDKGTPGRVGSCPEK